MKTTTDNGTSKVLSRTAAVKSILLPLYSEARLLLRILEGVPRQTVTGLIRSVYLCSGSPQATVKWSDPNNWIDEFLSGDDAALAKRIWIETQHEVNPRYLKGIHLFLNKHELVHVRPGGIYFVSEKGFGLIQKQLATLAQIDNDEGMLYLLNTLSDLQERSREELRVLWTQLLEQTSRYRSASSVRETLRQRIHNLEERLLIAKSRHVIRITEDGRKYLDAVKSV